MKNCINEGCAVIAKFVNELKIKDFEFVWKPFRLLLCAYILALYPLFRANYYYMDDLGRAVYGYRGWENFSRWLSNFLAKFIHVGGVITDISPIPQVIALALMALAGAFLVHLFNTKKEKSWVWATLVTLPMGLSPYFMQCFSFKYDAPYMALSVLASIVPFLYLNHSSIVFITISFVGILVMCCTYQAASGIYVILALYLIFHKWNEGADFKESIKKIILSAITYLAGMIFYKLFLVAEVNAYVTTGVGNSSVFVNFVKNATRYLKFLISDSANVWIYLVVAIAVLYVINMVVVSKQNKFVTLLLAIVLLPTSLVLSYGAYLVLEKTIFDARAMLGSGVLVAIVAVSSTYALKKNLFSPILGIGLSWCLLVYSASFGNALAAQHEYDMVRINLVLQDLNKIPVTKDSQRLQFEGSIGHCPIVKLMSKRYPVIKRIVHPLLANSKSCWNEIYMFDYINLPKYVRHDESKFEYKIIHKPAKYNPIDIRKLKFKTIANTRYHTIKSDGKNVLVQLR